MANAVRWELRERERSAAIKIQSIFRCSLAKRDLVSIIYNKYMLQITPWVLIIQKNWRMYRVQTSTKYFCLRKKINETANAEGKIITQEGKSY